MFQGPDGKPKTATVTQAENEKRRGMIQRGDLASVQLNIGRIGKTFRACHFATKQKGDVWKG